MIELRCCDGIECGRADHGPDAGAVVGPCLSMAATGHTAGDVPGDWIYDDWADEATDVAPADANVRTAAELRGADDVVGHRCKSEFASGDLSAVCDQSDAFPGWAIVL